MAEGFKVGVQDDLIIVREPTTGFYAIYAKPAEQSQLILKRRKPTNDHSFLLEPGGQRTRKRARSGGLRRLSGRKSTHREHFYQS
jgi:hypothetical protein